MSTRGAIAFGNLKEWKGVYQHFDSYPTHLGKVLWAERPQPELLEQHPGGFSAYPEVCYCHDEYFAARDGSAAKDSPYYREDAPKGMIVSDNADPLFIEWVYVFNYDENVMHILAGRPVAMLPEWKGLVGSGVDSKVVQHDGVPVTIYSVDCAYAHVLVATVSLYGEEPDWAELESRKYTEWEAEGEDA